ELSTSEHVDLSTLPVTISWYKDSNGNGIPESHDDTESDPVVDDPGASPVAVFTIDPATGVLTDHAGVEYPVNVVTDSSGTVASGRVLWPGAAVDSSGVGIAWPGYRVAGPGETPTWENYLYDE